MEPMTNELKETIIREYPDGIWLVLAVEHPPHVVTADDLLSGPSLDGSGQWSRHWPKRAWLR